MHYKSQTNQKKHKANAILDENEYLDIFLEESKSDFDQNQYELSLSEIRDIKDYDE